VFFAITRTPHDSKHLNGWRGIKHWLVYTRQQANADLNGYRNKFTGQAVRQPVIE